MSLPRFRAIVIDEKGGISNVQNYCDGKLYELSAKAFEVMKEVITSKSNPVLGLATGSSPIGLYQNMIKDHKENGTSYKNVVTNLDEYIGLKRDHSQTYWTSHA